MTRRIALAILAVWGFLIPAASARTLGFYGRVNHWMDSRSEIRKELRLMEESGVDGYMIEMAGQGRLPGNLPNCAGQSVNTVSCYASAGVGVCGCSFL